MRNAETARTALREFAGDPQRAQGIAGFLGFEPVAYPEDALSGNASSGLGHFFGVQQDIFQFGVKEFYRVGTREADSTDIGLWVGVLEDWGQSSADRDRPRHRIAEALVEHIQEPHSLAFMTPPAGHPRSEAELVLPRTLESAPHQGPRQVVGSTRATLDFANPSDFHCNLLTNLKLPKQPSLLGVARQWQAQFSVERVASKFYTEYATIRNHMAQALLDCNPNHGVVAGLRPEQRLAWSTRQMGRVLFLWFLQAKRWLGKPNGEGDPNYMIHLWGPHRNTPEGDYYRGVLLPLFFEAMATGIYSASEHPTLGYVPYLNGGLFQPNELEEEIATGGVITLPDGLFDPAHDDSLLGLLSRYQFTTRESTPDSQSVDPDPELLGRVFENLHEDQKRRKSGTYYTPREIVHFMCREVLDGYLLDQVPKLDQSTLNAIRRQAIGSQDEDGTTLPEPIATKLEGALDRVRICDPAVGSGAFLMGILQEMLLLKRGLLFASRRYIPPDELYETVGRWKNDIIMKNLHGVDNDPEAVEICHLRLWLSMVMDMPEPPETSRGWALPSLDLRVIAGDSLVDRMPGLNLRESWPTPWPVYTSVEPSEHITQLKRTIAENRSEFDQAHLNPQRIGELRNTLVELKRELVRRQLLEALTQAREELSRRTGIRGGKNSQSLAEKRVRQFEISWEEIARTAPGLSQKPFLWTVAFPETIREDDPSSGFDIVLSNPPYVRQENIDPRDRDIYRETFPEVYHGSADKYVYFYARATQLLRPGGWLGCVTSNAFTKRLYGNKLRSYLAEEFAIARLVDFGEVKMFDAYVEPYIFIGRKGATNPEATVRGHNLYPALAREIGPRASVKPVRDELVRLPEYLATEVSHFDQSRLQGSEWRIGDDRSDRLYHQQLNSGIPLANFLRGSTDGTIHIGVKTGLDDAFVIDSGTLDSLLAHDSSTREIIKPFAKGGNIARWRMRETTQFLIFTGRGLDIDRYPAVRDHLYGWYPDLEPKNEAGQAGRGRRPGRYAWYELQDRVNYHEEFNHPKILWPDVSREVRFALDTDKHYPSISCLTMPQGPRWLLPVLNSRLAEFLICQIANTVPGTLLRVNVNCMERLPIVVPEAELADRLGGLTDQVLAGELSQEKIESVEREIDAIVFHVYGLTTAERKLVLDWIDERREALGTAMHPDWRRHNILRAAVGPRRAANDPVHEYQGLRQGFTLSEWRQIEASLEETAEEDAALAAESFYE